MKYLILSALLSSLTPVLADDLANPAVVNTGNELRTYCTAAHEEKVDDYWTICTAMVNGILQGLSAGAQRATYMVSRMDDDKTDTEDQKYALVFKMTQAILGSCVPDNVTRNQIALVVTKYLERHPEELNRSSSYLVMASAREAWPCSPSK